MLQSLHIQNFALIPELHLDFENGYSVFTGETGSGKSIILGALNLILGERADYSVIRNQEVKTIVEAVFKIKNHALTTFFEENDLDYLDETTVRREITSQGKSRAFINDTPVQLTVLKDFTEKLIYIHSQHHTLNLKEQNFQFDFLDYISNAIVHRNDYKELFSKHKYLHAQLSKKKSDLDNLKKEEDYHLFQLNELEGLNLRFENYANLEDELVSLENFADVKATFEFLLHSLTSDQEILDKVNNLKALLEKNKHLHPSFIPILEQIKATISEFKDIQFQVEREVDSLQNDPQKKLELENKLSKYNQVLLKHNFSTQDDLLKYYDELEKKQASSLSLEEEILELELEIKTNLAKLTHLDEIIQTIRNQEKDKIENEVKRLLEELKMPASKFIFSMEDIGHLTELGSKKISILFSPNTGIEAKPIEKVASGGELSRLMLCMQLMLSDKKSLPTIIFDEIDTGVSGDVAQKLGDLLFRMGKKMQVFTITHLPQVAAKGNHHFKVSKTTLNNETVSSVLSLNSLEKINEVARLMSGENINAAAIENAKILMNLN